MSRLPLKNKHGDIVAWTCVDADDLLRCSQFTWRLSTKGYATSKHVYLHRFIMAAQKTDGTIIDHRNHNILDNRKQNLRYCTNSENLRNRAGLATNNTSGVPGVCWHTSQQKWLAFVWVDHKMKHLGIYVDKVDAIKAREDAVRLHYGEFGTVGGFVVTDKAA